MGAMKALLGDKLWSPSVLPDFDGATYIRSIDHKRLSCQHLRVFLAVADGRWYSLNDICAITSDPPASVSARLRDFRKPKFGGHKIERRRLNAGLFEYRLAS